jgi:hypothetical protein
MSHMVMSGALAEQLLNVLVLVFLSGGRGWKCYPAGACYLMGHGLCHSPAEAVAVCLVVGSVLMLHAPGTCAAAVRELLIRWWIALQ